MVDFISALKLAQSSRVSAKRLRELVSELEEYKENEILDLAFAILSNRNVEKDPSIGSTVLHKLFTLADDEVIELSGKNHLALISDVIYYRFQEEFVEHMEANALLDFDEWDEIVEEYNEAEADNARENGREPILILEEGRERLDYGFLDDPCEDDEEDYMRAEE